MAHMLTSPNLSSANPRPRLEEGLGEEPQSSPPPSNIHKVVAELLGTYMLVFIGCGSLFVDQRIKLTLVGVALVCGTLVVALVYTFGHISGAHFNPAATVAIAAIGRFPWKLVPFYMVAQLLGSIAASFTLSWVFDGDRVEVMLSLPSSSTSNLSAVVIEIIVSFILIFVICSSAIDKRAINDLYGVAIGATVFFNSIIAGTISGCSMNPARSIGPAIVAQDFHKLWIYVISPVIGMVVGSTLYHLCNLLEMSTLKIMALKTKNCVNPIYSEN